MIYEGTVVIPLQKPLRWENDTINEVALDFSKVTGKVVINAERAVFQGGSLTIVRSMSADYCAHIAAAISGLHYRALEKLHGADFDAVWQTVAAFVANRNPQEFYDQYSDDSEEDLNEESEEESEEESKEDPEADFTSPANGPE